MLGVLLVSRERWSFASSGYASNLKAMRLEACGRGVPYPTQQVHYGFEAPCCLLYHHSANLNQIPWKGWTLVLKILSYVHLFCISKLSTSLFVSFDVSLCGVGLQYELSWPECYEFSVTGSCFSSRTKTTTQICMRGKERGEFASIALIKYKIKTSDLDHTRKSDKTQTPEVQQNSRSGSYRCLILFSTDASILKEMQSSDCDFIVPKFRTCSPI